MARLTKSPGHGGKNLNPDREREELILAILLLQDSEIDPFYPLLVFFPDREGVERGWGRQSGGDPCRHDGQGRVPATGLQEPLRGRLCLDSSGTPPHPLPR